MACRDVVWIWATATAFLVALLTGTFRYTADKGSNSDRPDRLPKEFPEHNSQLADSFQQANRQLAPLLSAHKRLSIRETKRTLDGALANYLNDHRCEEKVKEVNKKLCEIIPVSVHPCIVCESETTGSKIPYDEQSKEMYAQMVRDAGKEADKLKDKLKEADEGKLDWHDIDDEIQRVDDLVSNLTKVANHLNNMMDQDPNDKVAKKHLDDIKDVIKKLKPVKVVLEKADDNCLQSPDLKPGIAAADDLHQKAPAIADHIQGFKKPPPKPDPEDEKFKQPEEYVKDVNDIRSKLIEQRDLMKKAKRHPLNKTRAEDQLKKLGNVAKAMDDLKEYIDHIKKKNDTMKPDEKVDEFLNCTKEILNDAEKYLNQVKDGKTPTSTAEEHEGNLDNVIFDLDALSDHLNNVASAKKNPSPAPKVVNKLRKRGVDVDDMAEFIKALKFCDPKKTSVADKKKDMEKLRDTLADAWTYLKYAEKKLPEYTKTPEYIQKVDKMTRKADKIVDMLSDPKRNWTRAEIRQVEQDMFVFKDELKDVENYVAELQKAEADKNRQDGFNNNKRILRTYMDNIEDFIAQLNKPTMGDLQAREKAGEKVTPEDMKKVEEHEKEIATIRRMIAAVNEYLDKKPPESSDPEQKRNYHKGVESLRDELRQIEAELTKAKYDPGKLENIRHHLKEVEKAAKRLRQMVERVNEKTRTDTEPTTSAAPTTVSQTAAPTVRQTTPEMNTENPCTETYMDDMEPVKYCKCRSRGHETFVRYNLSRCGDDGVFLCVNGECLNLTNRTHEDRCTELFGEKYGTAPAGTYYSLVKRVPEECAILCCLRLSNNTAVCHDYKDPPDKCRL